MIMMASQRLSRSRTRVSNPNTTLTAVCLQFGFWSSMFWGTIALYLSREPLWYSKDKEIGQIPPAPANSDDTPLKKQN